MRRHLTWLLLVPVALLALAASACGGSDASGDVPSDAVAVVGDETITKTEFNELLDQAKRSYEQRNQKFPAAGSPEYEQLKSQAVNYLVQQSEYDQKASDLDITISDEQVDKRLKDLKKQYFGGSEEKYKKQLEQQGLTEEQVRTQLHNQLLQEAIFKDITGDVKVTDEEVRKYYDDNRAQYQTGESRDVRHILLACGASAPGQSSSSTSTTEKPKDCTAAKQEAAKLYDQLQDGANFATLAKKYSDDPGSKAQGGKLTVQRGQTVAAFDQTAFMLGKGTISRPVKTQYGYHIIEPISEIRSKKTTPYSQVKEAIRQQLLTTQKNEFMADWVKDLKEEFNVSYQVGYKPQAQATQPQ